MKLVILFPDAEASSNSSLLRKDESDVYYETGSNSDPLSKEMSSLSVNDPLEQKTFPGVIIEGENFENLYKAAFPLVYKYLKRYSNMVLQVKPNCFVWFEDTDEERVRDLIDCCLHNRDHQLVLFRADEPVQVSKDFNVEEKDMKKIMVHIFHMDSKGICSFYDKYSFDKYISNKIYDEKKCSYLILKEDGSYSSPLARDGSIYEIERIKKQFVTVVIKEEKPAQTTISHSSTNYAEHNAYKVAFDTKLVGKINSDRTRLLAAIRDVNQNCEFHNLYSPTVSICQGSGSGKSKLACSLDSDLACGYVVFRGMEELAYPEKSSLGKMMMACPLPMKKNSFDCTFLSETNIGVYVHIIYAIVSDYLARVKSLKKGMGITGPISVSQSQQIRQVILREFIEGTFTGEQIENFENGIKLIDLVKGKMEELSFDKFAGRIKTCCDDISHELSLLSATSPLVIVLDEVHILSGYDETIGTARLNLLRRAMHALGTQSGIVFVTLGTKSDYNDLNPIAGTDSMRDCNRTEIYPPFIVSRNTDIFRNQIAKLSISSEMLKDPRMILIRFSMGRPLWCSLAISEVIRIATIKLANSSLESGQAFVACWMLRTGIPASPHMVETSRHLLKSNMATLLDIHPELPLMNVCYPSEPVLAMAADDLVSRNLIAYFKNLRNHLVCKGFDRGDLAEVIAAEICIEAASNAKRLDISTTAICKALDEIELTKSKKFILESHIDPNILAEKAKKYNVGDCDVPKEAVEHMKMTTLENFLKSLYGEKNYENLNLESTVSRRMLNGIVNFNHFIRLNTNFNFSSILDGLNKSTNIEPRLQKFPSGGGRSVRCRALCNLGLKRGAAFFAPEHYPGTDLLIPICLEDEEEEVEDEEFEDGNTPNPVQKATEKQSSDSQAATAKSNTPTVKKFISAGAKAKKMKKMKKPTLGFLSIQVKAGALNNEQKKICARKFLLDGGYMKCSVKGKACQGCDHCETEENLKFLNRNQIALVFCFGDDEKTEQNKEETPTTTNNKNAKKKKTKEKIVQKHVERQGTDGSQITVLFNSGPNYLKGLWHKNFQEISPIVDDILSFSWLPHNFIPESLGTGPYHRNQLLENYLDKPLFSEFSDLFREELGWNAITNRFDDEGNYQSLIEQMRIPIKKGNETK